MALDTRREQDTVLDLIDGGYIERLIVVGAAVLAVRAVLAALTTVSLVEVAIFAAFSGFLLLSWHGIRQARVSAAIVARVFGSFGIPLVWLRAVNDMVAEAGDAAQVQHGTVAVLLILMGYVVYRVPLARLLAVLHVAGTAALFAAGGVPAQLSVTVLVSMAAGAVFMDLTVGIKQHHRQFAQIQEELATQDPLTGLLNRRGGTQALGQVSPGQAVLLIDLDHFKVVNDTHGHAQGDIVLRTVADVIQSRLRAGDVAIRWGGEEFLVLSGGTPSEDDGLAIAERLRTAIAECGQDISASVGVAVLRDEETTDSCLMRADQALYTAKAKGRDRSVTAC